MSWDQVNDNVILMGMHVYEIEREIKQAIDAVELEEHNSYVH